MHAWLENLRIKKKLWLFNLVTAMVSGIVSASILVALTWHVEKGAGHRDLEIKTAIIGENILPALQFQDVKTAREILNGLGQDRSVLRATLYAKDGEIFAAFKSPFEGTETRLASGKTFAVGQTLSIGKETLGRLELVSDLQQEMNELYGYIGGIAFATIISIIIGSYVVSRLQRAITDPLSDLSVLMKQVTEGQDYSKRAKLPSRDELGELGESFNRMIEQIQQRDSALGKELLERRRAEERLEHLAHHDPITGLPNRHSFREHTFNLDHLGTSNAPPMALLFIDLDNFKYVNDNFGHDCGDHLLTVVAQRLQGEIRNSDMLVRFGGDEFVLLLDHVSDTEIAITIAQKLLSSLTRPVVLGLGEFIVTCSIGVALTPMHASSFDELLQKADAAMYSAKNSGKNSVKLWEPEISDVSAARFSLEADLRRALIQQELEVHYQPIVLLSTGRVVGMEALMRWRHKTHGYIPPSEFIPVAEDCGIILALGEWMMGEAFSQAALWNKLYGALFIAVNVSARQFSDITFAIRTENIARAAGLPRKQIELELTESVVMGHIGKAEQVMQELCGRGFSLSLDDFGTGYSSLAYLKRFPLDKLKIDRSFVKDLPYDPESVAIAQAIVGLSGTLDMRVVAEGVETAAQARMLADLHCQYGQGYYFSKALPANEFGQFLAENRKHDYRMATT